MWDGGFRRGIEYTRTVGGGGGGGGGGEKGDSGKRKGNV